MLDRNSLRQILIPSWNQILVCLLITLAMLALASSRLLAGFFGSSLLDSPYIHQVVETNLSAFSRISAVNIAVIVGFWSAVYLVVYTLFWIITNVLVEARNEIVIETEFANRGSILDRLRNPLLQLVLGITLILFLMASCFFGFPNWLSLMQNALLNISAPVSILYAIGGLLACIINIYALWSLTQVVFAAD